MIKLDNINNITKEELLNYINNYLKEQKELVLRTMVSDVSFDSPAWSERQASLLGSLKAHNKLTDLLSPLTKGLK